MEDIRVRCDFCKSKIHRASYSRHLKRKKHLKKMSQNKVIISRKNPTKRVKKEAIKVSDTEVENRNCITDRIIKNAYHIIIDNHHDKDANSQITITSKFNNIGIDINHIIDIMKEKCDVYAKLVLQYKFKYQLTFLVIFYRFGEDNEILSEVELPITLTITHNLTQSELDTINIRWTLENRIQSVEMKESGWTFQRINSMGISLCTSAELNGSS